ncbi:MAG: hypothetical protein ABEJ55_05235 [Halanaeroarchaeum sp.]
MSFLSTVSDIVNEMGPASSQRKSQRSEGSYWCDDCGVRIRDVDHDGSGTPRCPDCGDDMRFERRPDAGSCAC